MQAARLIVILIALILTNQALATVPTDCTPGHDYHDASLRTFELHELESVPLRQRLTIGNIRVIRQNVFPHPNNWLFRKANQWHTPTKVQTVIESLPFFQGDNLDAAALSEAERLLRTRPYFYDARILIRQICDQIVDLDVLVREVWTLTPKLSVSRSGGENEASLGLADSNWRGSGRHYSLSIDSSEDDTRLDLKLADRQQKARWLKHLSATSGRTSYRFKFGLDKPFYTLNTQQAAGFAFAKGKREHRLYTFGDELFRFEFRNTALNVFGAQTLERGDQSSSIHRLYYGLRYSEQGLAEAVSQGTLNLPASRSRFTYPYIAWERRNNSYIKTRHLNHLGSVEDIDVGWYFYTQVGYAVNGLVSTESSLHVSARIQKNWLSAENNFTSINIAVDGRLNTSARHPENLVSNLTISNLLNHNEYWRTFTTLELRHGRNLDHANFLELGGSSGMRGYSNHYQTGNRSYRLLVEPRYDTQRTLLNLFKVGFVTFAAVGRTWFSHRPRGWAPRNSGYLANVGFGLRLDSIRTGSDQTIHFDIARPLISHGNVSSYELTITVKKGI